MFKSEPHPITSVRGEDVCPSCGEVHRFLINLHKMPNHFNVRCSASRFCKKTWEVEITLGSWTTDRGSLPEFKVFWKEVW